MQCLQDKIGEGGRRAINCFERRPVCNRPDPLFFCSMSLESEDTFRYLDFNYAVLTRASISAQLDLYDCLCVNRN